MEKPAQLSRPQWLKDSDELPHPHTGTPPGWAENYVTYFWDPRISIGAHIHMCCRPGSPTVWDEQVQIALPGDRYLMSKAISPGYHVQAGLSGPVICGVSLHCHEPYRKLTQRFVGGARLISGDEMRSGPLMDGKNTAVEMELVLEDMSPPYDLGSHAIPQDWGIGHFQQHLEISGWIAFDGERHEIKATGLRDHGWGPRFYSKIGYTTWYFAEFPESGRSFQMLHVTGKLPTPEFTYTCVSDRNSVTKAGVLPVAIAKTLQDTEAPVEFTLLLPDGNKATIKGTVILPLRAGLIEPSEIGIGTFSAPVANHHNINAFARFEWDGEIGYGVIQRTVDLLAAK